MMTDNDAVGIYITLERLGIKIWIDGGWGVDSLLEHQTRPHSDLDIVIEKKDLPAARSWLENGGYRDVPRDDTSAWNFVLGDDKGHEIDFHVIEIDDNGNGIYGPVERNQMYPAASLSGIGSIEGTSVRCISAEYQIKFHSGYELKEKDFKDLAALRCKFG